MQALNETVKHLEVKEARLVQVEREQGELKGAFGELTLQLSATQQDASAFKVRRPAALGFV